MIQIPDIRIAIVGAGPAGLYALGQLLEQEAVAVEIDVFERLPTPYGLVRAGVAPDHPEKKRIVKNLFDFYLKHPAVRFFGNVEIGRHTFMEELSDWYDAVIYAVGASTDNKLGIIGEDFKGSWAAREFVAWYNGHPDYSSLQFDFSSKRAVIIGNGNVALDVARLLTLPKEALQRTDIANYAIDALSKSNIEEVVILGRRSHFQGAFNNPELEELGHLPNVNISIQGDDGLPQEQLKLFEELDWQTQRKVKTLQCLASRPKKTGAKRIVFRFLSSPVALLGEGAVKQVKVVTNRLEGGTKETVKPVPTSKVDFIETGLVFRAIGYRGQVLPGLPFDEKSGTIPNIEGRIMKGAEVVKGNYVTGWIKRGPKGIIGSNKKCARDTVRHVLADYQSGKLNTGHLTAKEVLKEITAARTKLVSWKDWKKIDHQEQRQGRIENRPRVKQTSWDSLMKIAHS